MLERFVSGDTSSATWLICDSLQAAPATKFFPVRTQRSLFNNSTISNHKCHHNQHEPIAQKLGKPC